MKKVFVYTIAVGFMLILYGCPTNFLHECWFDYPINIKNLKDTIKTTDTLWIENDFDPRFCYDNYIFEHNSTNEWSTIMKLMSDTLVFYEPIIINETKLQKRDGRYKSKYGIVFPDIGIYSLHISIDHMYEDLHEVLFSAYFDTPSNNIHLLPQKLQEKYNYPQDEPYSYRTYYIAVVE